MKKLNGNLADYFLSIQTISKKRKPFFVFNRTSLNIFVCSGRLSLHVELKSSIPKNLLQKLMLVKN